MHQSIEIPPQQPSPSRPRRLEPRAAEFNISLVLKKGLISPLPGPSSLLKTLYSVTLVVRCLS